MRPGCLRRRVSTDSRGGMTTPVRPAMPATGTCPKVVSDAIWLHFRFLLSPCMMEKMRATRGIAVSHETVRQCTGKLGQPFTNEIGRKLPKRHADEVVITISGKRHCLWRAVDQDSFALDILV